MARKIKDLKIEFSKHVRSVESLLLEGERLTNAVLPNGNGWILKLEEFNTKDEDLDVAFTIKGDPGVTAKVTVDGTGLNPKSTSVEATFKSHSYVSKDIEIKTLTN